MATIQSSQKGQQTPAGSISIVPAAGFTTPVADADTKASIDANKATLDSILIALGLLSKDTKLEAVRELLAGTLTVNTGLTGLASETKLEAVRALLASTLTVNTGLTGLATDTKLEAVRTLLTGLASETKLEAVRALLSGTLTVNTGLTGLASETKLEAVRALLAGTLTVNTGLTGLASETKLEAVRALLAGTLTVNTGLTGLASETKLEAVRALLAGTLVTNPIRTFGPLAHGSVAIAVTGTAVRLPTMALENSILLRRFPSNAANLYYGSSTVANSMTGAGASVFLDSTMVAVSIERAQLNDLWINGVAGDGLTWMAH